MTGTLMNRRLIHCKQRRGRAGFTLLEILVASLIVAMLMLIIGRIYTDANAVYNLGTRDVDIAMEVRAVMDIMARELSSAPAGPNHLALCVTKDPNKTDFLNDSDEIFFVSMDGNAENYREARQIRYYVKRTNTVENIYYLRRVELNDVNVYDESPEWWEASNDGGFNYKNAHTMLENIFLFEVIYYGHDSLGFYEIDDGDGDGLSDGANSVSDPYPKFIDIILGVFSEDDARRWALLSVADQTEYEERFGKVFRARVFLHNAYGYDMMTR
jgi:prepilin-type N-terminal cleavage/methylation domain-containing protein